jgi:CheY-like chemotaxis protein
MIRVLLVDDHPVVRAGYKRLLETDAAIEVVAEANDADSAYLAFVVYKPDVTVMDLSMPGVSGLSLLQKMLMRDASAKILICSMYDTPLVKRKALEVFLGYEHTLNEGERFVFVESEKIVGGWTLVTGVVKGTDRECPHAVFQVVTREGRKARSREGGCGVELEGLQCDRHRKITDTVEPPRVADAIVGRSFPGKIKRIGG